MRTFDLDAHGTDVMVVVVALEVEVDVPAALLNGLVMVLCGHTVFDRLCGACLHLALANLDHLFGTRGHLANESIDALHDCRCKKPASLVVPEQTDLAVDSSSTVHCVVTIVAVGKLVSYVPVLPTFLVHQQIAHCDEANPSFCYDLHATVTIASVYEMASVDRVGNRALLPWPQPASRCIFRGATTGEDAIDGHFDRDVASSDLGYAYCVVVVALFLATV